MRAALEQADLGVKAGEWPFGALVVRDGVVLAAAHDLCINSNDPTAHAETVAIRSACTATSELELPGATLYTICEPCTLCCGAIHWARIERIVFALSQSTLNALTGGNPKPPCTDLLHAGKRRPEVVGGVLEEEARLRFLGFPMTRRSKLRERFLCAASERDAGEGDFMRLALATARKAQERGEAGGGAVIVHAGKVIARAFDLSRHFGSELHHAEMGAMRQVERFLSQHPGEWDLYASSEPCPMCKAAAVQLGIRKIVCPTSSLDAKPS